MHLIESADLIYRGGLASTRTAEPAERGLLSLLADGIGTLFGGVWANKKSGTTRRLQVLETLSIGPKKQMLLISCDGEKYLVATGPESVQTILRVESRTEFGEPS